ncbi:MAG TPA: hypothetical protein VHS55_00615 [Solirubrobacteraceae bacterium]|jgi:hypothetical protein|nr:hypothetical protein [Solirubrobacteraceae bacterium]
MTPPAAVAEALPRQRPAPRRAPVRHPRRISGPARPARSAPRAAPRTEDRSLALRAIGAYERVCDSALLDRLVRGRLWIGLLAFALIGIVAMQLLVLRLNTGIGTTLAREAALQRANAQLGIEAATGSGEGRIEPLAAATGMTFAPSGSVHFVASSPSSDISRAAAALAAPIQPHESVASSETGSASKETTSSQSNAGSTEGSGESSSGSGEATSGEAVSRQTGANESSTAGTSEAAPTGEAHSSEASAAAASESEPSASAAGGVAAGH